jgi:hypothetical protein
MQFAFGTGVFWGTPLTDANGNAIANPTPVQLGVLQDLSLDLSFDTKTLYGQNQFPVAVGRGKGKMSGKSKFAQLNGVSINSLVFGQTMTNGLVSDFYDVAGSVIPATPFTVTPVIPNSGTFSYDLGVRDANGIPMTRVASAPTTGQYSVAAGVYTFAAADVAKQVFISYQYTATSTTAKKSTVGNVLMGLAPTFKGDIYVPYNGKSMILTIPQCVCSKFTFSTKQDDFLIPEFNFEGFADSAGNALYWSTSE